MTTPAHKRVLLVEDSNIQAVLLSRVLQGAGYDVVTAPDGRAALALLQEQAFDAVLTDINMPEMNGIALLQNIRQDASLKDLHVLVVTALTAPADLLAAASAGADQFILKPYSDEHLLHSLADEIQVTHPRGIDSPVLDLNVNIEGRDYTVHAPGQRLLKLLLSTYASATTQNAQLQDAQLGVKQLNLSLQSQLQQAQRARETLRLSEDNFRSIVSLVPDVVYRIDTEGRFEFINEAIHQYGWEPAELIGQHFSSLLDADDAQRASRASALPPLSGTRPVTAPKLFDERRTGERATVGLEVKVRCKQVGEAQPAEAFCIASEVSSSGLYKVVDGASTLVGTIGVIRNVAERKRHELELLKLNQVLEEQVKARTTELRQSNQQLSVSLAALEAQKSQLEVTVAKRTADLRAAKDAAEEGGRAKSLFIANMSHEVRTPLNAILGLSYLLDKSELTEFQREKLHQIEAAAQRLAKLFNDVLDLASAQSSALVMQQSPINITQVCDDVVRQIQAIRPRKGPQISHDVPADLPECMGDRERLSQALYNLAENGIKFTTTGSVTIRVRRHPQADTEGVGLQFEVIDTGVGISAEQQAQLFMPFSQLDPSATRQHGGAGLGLAITKLIVQSMGGELGVESQAGQGSRFWFRVSLPAASAANEAPAPSAEQQLNAAQLTLHALVVEDDAVMAQITRGFLKHIGCSVDTARNGQQALEMVQAAPDRYPLILMDLQMPVMGGLEATRCIRQVSGAQAATIIGLTASDPEEAQAACLEAGMNDCVAKAADPTPLYETLLRALPLATPRPTPPGQVLAGAVSTPANPAQATPEQQRALELLSTLHTVDQAQALRAVGDASRLLQLLRSFNTQHRETVTQLRLQLGQQNWEAMRFLSHTLRGAASTLGLKSLASAVKALESLLQHAPSNAADLEAPVQQIERAFESFSQQLQRLPAAPSAATDAGAPALDKARLATTLLELNRRLSAYEASAVTFYNDQRLALAAAMGDDAAALAEAIDNFDFDLAQTLLAPWLVSLRQTTP